MTRTIALAALVVAAPSCAQTINAVPGALPATAHDFQRLKGKTVSVVVLDRRAKQNDSAEIVGRLRDDVSAALAREGVRLAQSDRTDARLRVRINFLQADFELGNWVGCARFEYDFAVGGSDSEPAVQAVDRCVKKSNLLGYETASSVVGDAYAAAMSELLSKLELTIEHATAAAHSPAPMPAPAGSMQSL